MYMLPNGRLPRRDIDITAFKIAIRIRQAYLNSVPHKVKLKTCKCPFPSRGTLTKRRNMRWDTIQSRIEMFHQLFGFETFEINLGDFVTK